MEIPNTLSEFLKESELEEYKESLTTKGVTQVEDLCHFEPTDLIDIIPSRVKRDILLTGAKLWCFLVPLGKTTWYKGLVSNGIDSIEELASRSVEDDGLLKALDGKKWLARLLKNKATEKTGGYTVYQGKAINRSITIMGDGKVGHIHTGDGVPVRGIVDMSFTQAGGSIIKHISTGN